MRRTNWFCYVLILLFLNCGQKEISTDIYGSWEASNQNITVRTSPEWMKFEFHKGTADVSIEIKANQTVTGSIGGGRITEGRIKTNWLMNPETTGVAYTIEMNLEGKIHDKDPLPTKEVEFWISPNFQTTAWELRYTDGGAHFPMAGIEFRKVE